MWVGSFEFRLSHLHVSPSSGVVLAEKKQIWPSCKVASMRPVSGKLAFASKGPCALILFELCALKCHSVRGCGSRILTRCSIVTTCMTYGDSPFPEPKLALSGTKETWLK